MKPTPENNSGFSGQIPVTLNLAIMFGGVTARCKADAKIVSHCVFSDPHYAG